MRGMVVFGVFLCVELLFSGEGFAQDLPFGLTFEVDFTVGRRDGVWAVECTGGRQVWFPDSD